MNVWLGFVMAASINIGYSNVYPGLAAEISGDKFSVELTTEAQYKKNTGRGNVGIIRTEVGEDLRLGATSSWQETEQWEKWTFSPYVKYKTPVIDIALQQAVNSWNKETSLIFSKSIKKNRLKLSGGWIKLNGPVKRYGAFASVNYYPWKVK